MTTTARIRNDLRVHPAGTCYSLSCNCSLDIRRSPVELPRAYAYARRHLLILESEVNRTRERLSRFATESGFELAGTFIEEFTKSPLAFERLYRAVVQDEVKVIILPSLHHFTGLGTPVRVKEHLEAATGARLVSTNGYRTP